MNDERTLLEQRIAWLEWKMVRVIWTGIGLASLGVGFFAYILTVDHLGGFGAFGIAVVAWIVSGVCLQRSEFRGAPKNIRFIDP